MRADHDLAYMLQFEHVAWYEDHTVRILDRRIYPIKIEYVVCKDYREVAKAIGDMVTQSAGPYTAAGMGMALAAYQSSDLPEEKQWEYLKNASEVLSNARPTTASRMKLVTEGCLDAVKEHLGPGSDEVIFQHTVNNMNHRYEKIDEVAKYLVKQFPKKGKIMTQCFGETIVGTMLRRAREEGKDISLFVPETRPFLQGARFTATVAKEMGFDTTVITDNMPAFVLQKEDVDLFTSAADAITLDGHVVNKVGTFQIAIACQYTGVPYFVTGIPDRGNPKIDTVEIEYRDPFESISYMGKRHTIEGVKGYYPAFDITPPGLISGVVTDLGIYSPYDLNSYMDQVKDGFYTFAV